ncbi:MAG: hypothetical protein K0S23_2702 [Fluviicola sp.]|jgi:hypothetical protein|nr:hypothetical protein [Fluviicola sp.]
MKELIIKIASFLVLIIGNYIIYNSLSLKLNLVKYFH